MILSVLVAVLVLSVKFFFGLFQPTSKIMYNFGTKTFERY